ncbi:MAG: hypothetical protein M3384_12400, partial [Acidobacteriota bacterium]|nr:hypothetical protein [Acidobacteriota bacterium]
MNIKKARAFAFTAAAAAAAARKKPMPMRLEATSRAIIIAAVFCAVLPCFIAGFAAAQTSVFSRTGKIRAVVSETESKTPSWRGTALDGGFEFSGVAKSKVDFYFTYSALENGAPTEKWVALPGDRNWSELSNQPVRASGTLKGNKLLNAAVTPLSSQPEDYLTSPPPTVGLYKVVAVPLTIQPPQPAAGSSGKRGQSSDDAAA